MNFSHSSSRSKPHLIKAIIFFLACLLALHAPIPAFSASRFDLSSSWIFLSDGKSIWLIHPDGSGLKQIAAPGPGGATRITSLKWSPDGQMLAYVETGDEWPYYNGNLWIYALADAQTRLVAAGLGRGFDWFPDSQALLFDKYAEQKVIEGPIATCPGDYLTRGEFPLDGLYRVELAGGAPVRLVPAPGKYPLYYPQLSPDGAQVIFAQHKFDRPLAYYNEYPQFVAPLARPGQVSGLRRALDDCDWAPDSQRIACGTWEGDCTETYCPLTLYDLQGEVIGQIPGADSQYDLLPVWSPDGGWIAFSTTPERFWADGPCGGGSQPWRSANSSTISLYSLAKKERSSLGEGLPLGWSPDGQRLLVQVGGDMYSSGEIWVVDLSGSRLVNLGQWQFAAWQPASIPVPEPVSKLEVRPGYLAPYTLDNGQVVQPCPEGEGSNPIRLLWQMPAGAPELPQEVEVRLSTRPLEGAAWAGADAGLVNSPYPGDTDPERVEWCALLPADFFYQPLYFAVRWRSDEGSWSAFSETAHYAESGFRPERDGYQFSNNSPDWGRYPAQVTVNDFTYEDMRRMFGEAVCETSACSDLSDSAWLWLDMVNALTSENGHCSGMSISSQNFFRHPNRLAELVGGAQFTFYDLVNLSNIPVRNAITYEHVKQLALPVFNYKMSVHRVSTPKGVLEQVRQALGDGEDVEIAIQLKSGDDPKKKVWHSLNPIAVLSQPEGKWMVVVYDSLSPGRLWPLTIDPGKDTWSYGDGTNQGGKLDFSLYTIPQSLYAGPQTYPPESYWVLYAFLLTGSASVEDGSGSRQEASPVPGASDSQALYLLEPGGEYTLHLAAGNESEEGAAVKVFGPGRALEVSGIALGPAGGETLSLAGSGSRITFSAGQAQRLSLRIADDALVGGVTAVFSDLAIEAGASLEVEIDPAAGSISLSHGGDGGYQLELHRSGEEQVFRQEAIKARAGEKATFRIDGWQSAGMVEMVINRAGGREKAIALKGGEMGGLWSALVTFPGNVLLLLGLVLLAAGAVVLVCKRSRG